MEGAEVAGSTKMELARLGWARHGKSCAECATHLMVCSEGRRLHDRCVDLFITELRRQTTALVEKTEWKGKDHER